MPSRARSLVAALASTAMLAPAFIPSAHAQSDADRIRELERKLERSTQLIEQLAERVRQLEGKAPAPAARPAAAPAAAAPDAATQARIEALERSVAQSAAASSASDHSVLGVPIHGFADVGWEKFGGPTNEGRKSGFVLGNLDFFVSPSFGNVKTLAELVFEVNDQGGLATDLERVQVGYTFNDALTAWIGRFHTPYGYWNTAMHHGAQIQLAASRPRFIDFEDRGGILPAHSVGLWLTGAIKAGGGAITYDAYLANGNRIVDGTLDFQAKRDDNSNKLLGGNVAYKFGGSLDGVVIGAHGLRQDVASVEGDLLLGKTRVQMLGAYYNAEVGDFESLGEYYRFSNKDLSYGGGTKKSWVAFLQAGYGFGPFTPYLRWERAALDANDLYFASQAFGTSYRRTLAGVRYTINTNTVFKLEAGRTREVLGEDKTYNEARAQFAVRF